MDEVETMEEGEEATASTSNAAVMSSGDSESNQEASSESHCEDSSSSSSEDEEAELPSVLKLLRGREDIKEILQKLPIPSATGIVTDAESISEILHSKSYDLSVQLNPEQAQHSEHNTIIDALKNISERLGSFQPLPGQLPANTNSNSALHAARQVTYWSSLFVSMMEQTPSTTAPSATAPSAIAPSATNTSTSLIDLPPSRIQPSSDTGYIDPPTLVPSDNDASTSATSSHDCSQSTVLQLSSRQTDCPSTMPTSSSAVAPVLALSQDQPPSSTAIITQSTPSQSLLPGQLCFQPTCSTSSSTLHPSSFSSTASTVLPSPLVFSSMPSSRSVLSSSSFQCVNPSTPLVVSPSSSVISSQQPHVPSSSMQSAIQLASGAIDLPTLNMYHSYGSGYATCCEWLDSLSIPRNVEKLTQVRDLWETGTTGCPPLRQWTVTMRNHKSIKGKNASIFSQRKFIYNVFQGHHFDENSVMEHYQEIKPGKLYKKLNSKPTCK